MTRIVHFSDCHGQVPILPEADLYICTGDVLPNSRNMWMWPDKSIEAQIQLEWIAQNKEAWALAFASKGAPLILVRGNHDFCDIEGLFADHSGPKHEFKAPDIIDLLGYRIGGFRGVPPINGVWADEIAENEIDFRISQLYGLDILLTHGPAYQILDEGHHFGSKAIRGYVKDPKNAGLHHFFGHTHADGGKTFDDCHSFFSNAATTVNVMDIQKRRV